MDQLGQQIRRDFEETVKTWEQKPKFGAIRIGSRIKISIEVSTDDQVYMWVSRGTRAHPIDAVNAETMVFQYGDFGPKTSPGQIEAVPGYDNGELVFPRHVRHPGIKAREFDKQIQEKWEKLFPIFMGGVFESVAKSSGHTLDVSLRFSTGGSVGGLGGSARSLFPGGRFVGP
jgi:hypothetical protein